MGERGIKEDNWGLENFVRKQPISCDNQQIKNLFLRTIERSLMDLTGGSLALTKTQVSNTQKSYLKGDAIKFLRSEWCLIMCEYIGFNYYALLKKAEQVHTEHLEANKTAKKAKIKYRSF